MTSSWHRHVIALTGSIGSGKSTALEILNKLGAYVLSADDLSRLAASPSSPGLNRIVKAFGIQILRADNTLDRKQLAKIVFEDSKKRTILENILHPIIRDLAGVEFSKALKKKYPLYVYDIPLLFETGLYKEGFKKTVLISTPDELCIQRAAKRDGLTQEEVKKRLVNQMPLDEKRKLADIVINNSGSIEELENELKKLLFL